ncbi:MAG: hypothetical protein CSA60_02430 [Neptuniibacter caesariensis]|uniref:Molecular chaperone DnaJ n=1 Tax=Neptuniibacter caesariensis TaxID=207954 RepID=A0A2G6JQT5_NEPCE|nr:MAG: hypothetical protein CSA60_02430 [Neptuniibacter caesariensis]
MSFSEGFFSAYWLIGCALVYFCALVAAFKSAPWGVINQNRILQHMLLGATVLLMLLWSMRAGVSPGLGIHFLGMTVMTLVFGWDLAILAATLALVGMAAIGKESWDGLFVNGVCSVLLPVATTYLIYWYVEKRLLKNFFVFLFVCGFIGAGISTAMSGLATSSILILDGVYDLDKIIHEYIRYLPLIMFPEGLLNGIFLTGLMVFHPDWVRTFDAQRYIDEQ